MNKHVVSLLALAAICTAGPSAADPATLAASPYAVQPAFMPLRFGTIRPGGWILQQMRRDLKEGFAGHLDELCHEASSDIFASGRNRPGKPNAGNSAGDAWWNGETEGNWHCGHFMLACLTGEPEAMKKAKGYVDHILAAQDADGYLGIFSPELRYQGRGELWTQTWAMSANKDVETKLGLPALQRANGFGFTPKPTTANGANPDFPLCPLENPPVVLQGKLVRESDGTRVPVTLVPMGAQNARLRRVTFSVVAAGKK